MSVRGAGRLPQFEPPRPRGSDDCIIAGVPAREKLRFEQFLPDLVREDGRVDTYTLSGGAYTPPPPTLDPFPFLIVYELETDDLEKTIDELYDAHLTMQKRPEGSFDDRIYYWFYKASSEYVEASPATHPRVEPKNAEKAAALAKALAHGRPR